MRYTFCLCYQCKEVVELQPRIPALGVLYHTKCPNGCEMQRAASEPWFYLWHILAAHRLEDGTFDREQLPAHMLPAFDYFLRIAWIVPV